MALQRARPTQQSESEGRDLAAPVKTIDPRFARIRQRYEVHVRSPRRLHSYAQECDLGPVERHEHVLDRRHRLGSTLDREDRCSFGFGRRVVCEGPTCRLPSSVVITDWTSEAPAGLTVSVELAVLPP